MKIYTVNETAEELKIHPVTIRKWINEGRIKAVKVGSDWRVTEEELDRKKRGE